MNESEIKSQIFRDLAAIREAPLPEIECEFCGKRENVFMLAHAGFLHYFCLDCYVEQHDG